MEEKPPPGLRPPLQNSSVPRDFEPDPRDIDKIRTWQQQRIEKKLRGEYESAVLHLSEVINSNLTTPSQISSVRIEGAHHTRPSFLKFLIDRLIPPPSAENDLESALHAARHIADALQRTDIFAAVDAKLERATAVLAAKHDVDLVFTTRERGRFMMKTATELGNNEGSASILAQVRNVFGGAETFTANFSHGTTTKMAFNATLTAPLTSNLNTYGEMHLFGHERDLSSFASCKEGVRGAKALVTRAPSRGMHEFAYEAVLRHIGGLKDEASLSIREAAGQTVKSSVSHTFQLDNRDDRLFPTRGFYLKTAHEIAGFGGDAAFMKSETHAQMSRPLVPGVSVSLAARSGLLWGLNGRPTLFSDRFQLGGPSSIRSFRANSMGPRDNFYVAAADSLGGEMYWSAGLSVISNVPRKPEWPIKTHAWVNAGRLDNVDKSRSLQDNVAACLSKPSVSAGVGLIYNFDPVRVEVNFGLPLIASKSDGSRRGFQVGIGLEFL
ncbi:SAM50-like protein SPAC17C9.06 [Mycena sanguinolenta]|uniref:SAM50-like protein SPAC17C9.06 n=1 Tax=Mycena sanguinolenta TaxID=230812 RepID=A0A8H6X4Y5_9AGAR|nr:SAM50-like protein SPAC17C9.06 [Mycena sanguinolenta]